ncbi:tripartite tricarboxylate transporter substrate binding protein [Aquabacterium sp. J223]|uniref:tripartite tricarboxylate transporter substrate binding protein n=1 Tax=Aquabacterium sp. J223 TaxID=2898431 RepID=UPI0021AD6A14|nr:tripartite tricarboxylate transporter substrate binding protein [Aquabacterium sp. J223]UUX97776.1 tripartite tricarboxylate transporter substrate binding protein [Aquabacterium sp. J223]
MRVVVGFPPGGGADILARLMCDWLQQRLGQAFIVDNRPGAATNLATEAVVRAPADGHTLLKTTTSNLLNGALYDDLKYDFVRDIAPVAGISTQPLVLAAGPELAAVRTLPQFIAHARSHPGQLNLGHFGNGTISHLAAELLKSEARIDAVLVPYRGSAPMLTDLLGGRLHAAMDNLPSAIEHLRAGRLQALAVTTPARTESLPAVSAVAETLPGYEATTVAGLGAPRGTPAEVIERLNAEVNAALADPKVKARLAELGAVALPGSPADFGRFIERESAKWARVVRSSGIKPS